MKIIIFINMIKILLNQNMTIKYIKNIPINQIKYVKTCLMII